MHPVCSCTVDDGVNSCEFVQSGRVEPVQDIPIFPIVGKKNFDLSQISSIHNVGAIHAQASYCWLITLFFSDISRRNISKLGGGYMIYRWALHAS